MNFINFQIVTFKTMPDKLLELTRVELGSSIQNKYKYNNWIPYIRETDENEIKIII